VAFIDAPADPAHPPPVGALLVYARSRAQPDGHVAVVVGRKASHIYISEQNTGPILWIGYTRRLAWPLACASTLIGWKYPSQLTQV
jgi:surface antigen